MRRHALSKTMEYLVVIVIILLFVFLLIVINRTFVAKGEVEVNSAASINSSGISVQCSTFCLGFRTRAVADQKNAKCNTFTCVFNGNRYSYTCEGTNAQCTAVCSKDEQIPAACRVDCPAISTSMDCNTALENMKAAN